MWNGNNFKYADDDEQKNLLESITDKELIIGTFQLIEDQTIDIDSIEETEIKKEGTMKYFEYENNGATESGYSKNYSTCDIETRIKQNIIIQALKHLNKEIQSIKKIDGTDTNVGRKEYKYAK